MKRSISRWRLWALCFLGLVLGACSSAPSGGGRMCAGGPTVCGDSACQFTTPVVPTTLDLSAGCNTFNPVLDECDCDGKACAAGETCVHGIWSETGAPPTIANMCAVPCVAGDDCGPNNQCLPDLRDIFECRPPQCQSDADCTRDGCGRCVAALSFVHGTGQVSAQNVHVCVYEGACATTSCAFCSDAHSYSSPAVPVFHVCGS